MEKVSVYNQQGKEVGKMTLPVKIFDRPFNADLINQAVNAQLANARIQRAQTKDRSEVRGGGKKPWRQKGTGRARHGSIRSPLWSGGGVTFGPRGDKKFAKKINRQMKRQALLAVLSAKRRDEEVIILDELKLTQPKTKEAAQILKALAEGAKKELQRGALLALPEKESSVLRAFKNLPKIELIGAKNLNILDLLSNKYLILLKNSIEAMEQTFIKSAKK